MQRRIAAVDAVRHAACRSKASPADFEKVCTGWLVRARVRESLGLDVRVS
jgi:hypothetical protein